MPSIAKVIFNELCASGRLELDVNISKDLRNVWPSLSALKEIMFDLRAALMAERKNCTVH
jgi:hypothetical protein